jgi:methylase of polypeptide subunit release factors
MITYQVETWASMLPEASQIFPRHWEELALNQDKIKDDLDYERYALLAEKGNLHVVTARSNGILVGYAIFIIMTHGHYKSSGLMALSDMYYVLPEFRNGTGTRMFCEIERSLKEKGVILAMTSCKVHQDHSELFEKLGWQFSDKTFIKYLGNR